MARLAAQEKGEFYPTPLEVAEAIANLVHVKPSRNKPVLRLFDPCAGEGEALARVAEILSQRVSDDQVVETWGIEINERRAALAASRLDRVLACPFEVAGWKPSRWGVASLLFLNPPYDFSASSSYKRMETFFLERATPALEPGGLLAYIVPPAGLAWQSLHLLWQWYEEIEAYRFPDPLFEQFKQLVIFGKRRKVRDRRRYPGGVLTQISNFVRNRERLIRLIREQIPPLTDRPDPLVVPTTRVKASLFRNAWSRAEITAKVETDAAPALKRALADLYGPQEDVVLEALVSPKRGHIAQALASGVMGTMAFPSEVLKGRAVKQQVLVSQTETTNRNGDPVTEERYRDEYHNHIVRVTPAGLEYLSKPHVVMEFLRQNADRLADVMKDRILVYGDNMTPQEAAVLARLSPDRYLPGRDEAGLLDNQKETAIAMARALRRHGVGHLVGEMGYGKTTTALGTVEVTGAYPVLVICPPQIVDKWAEETTAVIPGSNPVIVDSISELEAVRRDHRPGDRTVVIMRRSRIKLGPGWHKAVNTVHAVPDAEREKARQKLAACLAEYRKARKKLKEALRSNDPQVRANVDFLRGVVRQARKEALAAADAVPTCPSCGQPVVDGRAIKHAGRLEKRPYTCPNKILEWDPDEEDYVAKRCGAPLWQSDEDGYRRWPLADYIAKKMPGFFRLLIVDEAHQYKAKGSDQGWAFGLLAQTIPWTLTLTGTFFGGPSTSVFWILHRTQPDVRNEFSFHGERRWIEAYGVEEVKVRTTRRGGVSHNRGRVRTSRRASEKPGISPAIVRHILPTTVFRSLSDLGLALPSFHDEVVPIEMTEVQARDYRRVYNETWSALIEFWPRYTASWLQWTLARPNSSFRAETIEFPDGDAITVDPVVDVAAGELLPKEEWLVSTVKAELAQRRRCLIYLRQTGTRDIRSRLVQVLAQEGVEAHVLRSSISPRKRMGWIKKHNPRVLITNPKLVETGLDLVQFATAVFFEPDYSLYTLWQACRRVWRLGQTKPVRVFYPIYIGAGRPVMEDLAIRLIGQKMAAAQLLYGDDVAGAIVPDMGDNLVVQLVDAIKSGEAEELAQAESLFGSDDRTSASPMGNPTRTSPPILTWRDWMRVNGVTTADIRPRRRRRRIKPQPGQLALGLGM